MLFNSYVFLFGFFPIALIGFFLIARRSHEAAAVWLASCSLFFYGWGNLTAVPLLLGSIGINYWFGIRLTPSEGVSDAYRKYLLWLALAANLALLSYFKYATFFIDNANTALLVLHLPTLIPLNIVLPIGISFFTFTQIAFLVDCWQGKVKERNFPHYLLFVSYFPHLIAGPILHHSQMMPQFAKRETYRFDNRKIALGILIFVVGLSKKLLLADPMGEYADALFKTVATDGVPMLFMCWFGALSYTFQIYFDFSGYTDMAIGSSLFFGIYLPVNFNSPYKSASIIEFWRRWHVSLSTFLRDYLYIPLGGNRNGKARRYLNLLVTMLLGGLWHGANWTFVLWGLMHGIFLVINHAWHRLIGGPHVYGPIGRYVCWLVTFLCVCGAWVMFRAENIRQAVLIYKGMLGLNGISLPGFAQRVASLANRPYIVFNDFWQDAVTEGDRAFTVVFVVAAIICFGTHNLNRYSDPAYRGTVTRQGWLGIAIGALLCLCLIDLAKSGPSPFIYFRF